MPEESKEVQKVTELFKAYQTRGLAGIKDVLHKRNEDHRKEQEANLPEPEEEG